jgi:hypothetical protein
VRRGWYFAEVDEGAQKRITGREEKQREAAARGAAIQTIVADTERRLQATEDTD